MLIYLGISDIGLFREDKWKFYSSLFGQVSSISIKCFNISLKEVGVFLLVNLVAINRVKLCLGAGVGFLNRGLWMIQISFNSTSFISLCRFLFRFEYSAFLNIFCVVELNNAAPILYEQPTIFLICRGFSITLMIYSIIIITATVMGKNLKW